jgi:tetratricopeptide (TPR) repeat protein
LVGKLANQQLKSEPDNIVIYENLAMFYHNLGKYRDAIRTYEQILSIQSDHAVALNNLAWILVTIPEEELRDKERALILAERAVALEKSPIFLDTLAETCHANGLTEEAVENIKRAISLAKGDRGYYEDQLKRFRAAIENK